MYSIKLAKFVSDIKYEDLGNDVIDMTKKSIMDYIGVSIAGYDKEASLILGKYIDEQNEQNLEGQANVLRPGFPKVKYPYAAFINAAYGHALDFDDLHSSSIVHPGVVTIPTAFALGQHLNKSGRDVIAAIVAGFEVATRVGEAINPSSYWYWHTTAIAGNFSSAATAGNLMNLDGVEMNHCFGSAGSQAAGLWEFINDGAMTKMLHVAKANMNGIIAAELAALGFTGATRILEGDKGLVKAIAPKYDLDKLTMNFGKPYKVMENSFKAYACCRHTHSANYAIEEIVRKYKIKAQDIKTIVDKTYGPAIDFTDNANPQTTYAHKFSLQYCISALLVYGNLSEEIFTEEKINNPLVQDTMKKVTVCLNEEINDIFTKNPDKWIHDLEVETLDGRILRERVEYPIGDVNNPFDWDMTENKFKTLLEPYLSKYEIESLIGNIHKFDELDNINELFSIKNTDVAYQ